MSCVTLGVVLRSKGQRSSSQGRTITTLRVEMLHIIEMEGCVKSRGLRVHPRSRPFGPRSYGSQGLTHYRVCNLTDRFQI